LKGLGKSQNLRGDPEGYRILSSFRGKEGQFGVSEESKIRKI
jgi:hypothetical protein